MKKVRISLLLVAVLLLAGPAMALQDFDQYWQHKEDVSRLQYQPAKSGVACPHCGEELLVDLTAVLTSNPPKSHAWCPKCGWRGYL
jgi:predicted RNA-binding Zn-ribbon protein involved in translation (DUF1610 family)